MTMKTDIDKKLVSIFDRGDGFAITKGGHLVKLLYKLNPGFWAMSNIIGTVMPPYSTYPVKLAWYPVRDSNRKIILAHTLTHGSNPDLDLIVQNKLKK